MGTKPSSQPFVLFMRRTRVQPSPWSISITCNSSPSFIGMLPSLVAIRAKKKSMVILFVIKEGIRIFFFTHLRMDIKLDMFPTVVGVPFLFQSRHLHPLHFHVHFLDPSRAVRCVMCPIHFQDLPNCWILSWNKRKWYGNRWSHWLLFKRFNYYI